MESTLTIRRATIDDVDRIAEILVAAWKWAYASFAPAELMAERTDLPRRTQRLREYWDDDCVTLVGVDNSGTVCGFASERRPCQLAGCDAEIGGLYVDPKTTRGGIGSALVSAMAHDFRSRELKSMAICALAQNEIGCNFYIKLGGIRAAESTWNGMPSVWFVWPSLELEGRS